MNWENILDRVDPKVSIIASAISIILAVWNTSTIDYIHISMFLIILIIMLTVLSIIYLRKHREDKIAVVGMLSCSIALIIIILSFVPSSYIIEIDYPGQCHVGFGSENLNMEGFTTNNIYIKDLGNTHYINIGVEKAESGTETLALKIRKKWLFYEEIVAENSTISPYGKVELHYRS